MILFNNSNKCSYYYGPPLLGAPRSFVLNFLYYMQGCILEFMCPRQTLGKGAYILHMLYKSFF